jgi:hypothetical protein
LACRLETPSAFFSSQQSFLSWMIAAFASPLAMLVLTWLISDSLLSPLQTQAKAKHARKQQTVWSGGAMMQ